jgi:arylsulfatase A-like enzyme
MMECFFYGPSFLIVLAMLSAGGSASAQAPRWNVLFIMSDDLRTELGCYGSKLAQTPNIDALAAAGVRFDRAYCQFSLCNPSRSSMLHGRYPITTGVLGNRTWIGLAHPDFVSLPKHFKANGYVTLRAGKIFHGGIDDTEAWTEGGEPRIYERPPPIRGVYADTRAEYSDRRIVLPGNGESHGDYVTADRAIGFLRKYRDQPFFLGCGFAKPHTPLEAPQRFYDMYDVNRIELPPDFAPRPTVPSGIPRLAIRSRNADLFIGRDATPQEAKETTRAYLASISYMDWNVGRVLAELDRLGLREKTIIVFWGDHGYQLGEKGKWSKAGSLFEHGVRVPLVIAPPTGAVKGGVSPRVVESIDLYPTLCELAGVPAPPGLEGRSLAPLVANPTAAWNHPAYTIWSEDGRTLTGVSVRTENWRYTEFDGGRGGAMLFNPAEDPFEMRNRAGEAALDDVRRELSDLIRQHTAKFIPERQ